MSKFSQSPSAFLNRVRHVDGDSNSKLKVLQVSTPQGPQKPSDADTHKILS